MSHHHSQNRRRSFGRSALIGVVAASLLSLVLPVSASAHHDRKPIRTTHHDHDRHDHDRRARYDRGPIRRHKVVVHENYCDSRSRHRRHDHDRYARRHRHHRSDRHDYRRHDRRVSYERNVYTCGPCNHRFTSRHEFHRHLHHKHRIPLWKLPFVIVHSAVGWIFHG